MNILEDIAKMLNSFCFIFSQLFNCKLQVFHGMVEDTVF